MTSDVFQFGLDHSILSGSKDKSRSHTLSQLVVFCHKKSAKDKSPVAISTGHKSLDQELNTALKDSKFEGKPNETLLVFLSGQSRHVLFCGSSAPDKKTSEAQVREGFRALGASLQNTLKSTLKELNCEIAVKTHPNCKELETEQGLRAFFEGWYLSSNKHAQIKSDKKESPKPGTIQMLLTKPQLQKAFQAALTKAKMVCEAVHFARELGDLPGNVMTPTELALRAQKEGKKVGLNVTVWNKEKIKKERFGGLFGVSKGSDQDPRFIIMEYKGNKASKDHFAFVGKGLTFDAGGISIKPSQGMEEMKYDMCGGANVIGAMIAIAKLKLKVNVTAYVPATENLVGGSANKPGDILTFRNGKTAEINNTDAEGRLILADALAYATEQKPKFILSLATLTGAMVVALGNVHTGFFTENDELAEDILQAGKASGEKLWRMPLDPEHKKDIEGTFADLNNISKSKGAGSATATAFLTHFVGENIPYLHFDIAGTAWSCGNRLNYVSKSGATGVLVRTLTELAIQRA